MDKLKKAVRKVQKHFIDSWLLPCSLRSHRIANPRPKIGFAIFRLYPPTTRQAGGTLEVIRASALQNWQNFKNE